MSDIVQFILMRTDMKSMNPGKAVAQGAHAANQMVEDIKKSSINKFQRFLEEWQNQTGAGFGTCYVMGVDENQLHDALNYFSPVVDNLISNQVISSAVVDPSYPITDGKVVHALNLVTCAYLFGKKEIIMPVLLDMGIGFMD